MARPEEEAAWEDYASSRRIAWKTGTSFGNRDAWAIGVDGRIRHGGLGGQRERGGQALSQGLGRRRAHPLRALRPPRRRRVGGLGAGRGGSSSAGTGAAEAPPAPALREIEVCAASGWAAGPDCEGVETVLVPAAVKSLPLCPYCASVALSADGRYRVRAEEEAPGSVRIEKRFALPPAMERFYARKPRLQEPASLEARLGAELRPRPRGRRARGGRFLVHTGGDHGKAGSHGLHRRAPGSLGHRVLAARRRLPRVTRKTHAIEARPGRGSTSSR